MFCFHLYYFWKPANFCLIDKKLTSRDCSEKLIFQQITGSYVAENNNFSFISWMIFMGHKRVKHTYDIYLKILGK